MRKIKRGALSKLRLGLLQLNTAIAAKLNADPADILPRFGKPVVAATIRAGVADSDYLDTTGAASFLSVSVKTLATWRVTGGGPSFSKIGRRCLYLVADLRQFAEKSRRTSTSEKAGRHE